MPIFNHSEFQSKYLLTGKVLDLGCGRNKLEGAIGVDFTCLPGVDFVLNLNDHLPFESTSFDVIHANQVFEHIENIVGLIKECHRILKPGGLLVVHVPYFRSSWAAIDPTHIRQYTLLSMNYFKSGTYEFDNYRFTDESFSNLECYLDHNYPRSPFRWFFSKLALRWPHYFENSLLSFVYPFQNLTFVLKK